MPSNSFEQLGVSGMTSVGSIGGEQLKDSNFGNGESPKDDSDQNINIQLKWLVEAILARQ